MLVENINLGVPHGLADGHNISCAVGGALPVRNVYGSFRWSVQVVQLGAEPFKKAMLQFKGEGLTAANDSPQAGALLNPIRFEEHSQHGRYEVQGGDSLIRDQVHEIIRVLMSFGTGHDQACSRYQGPKEFPDRDVKAVGRLLQHAIALVQTICVLHPEQAIDNSFVYVGHTFGLACGT